MPRRSDSDYEQRRQQIIAGALEVFAHKGFEKATNRDIAIAAGINSPGLIYHYFRDKADLFRQVIEQHAPALQLLSHSDELMDQPPREVLTRFGIAFTEMLKHRQTIAVFKVMLSEAMRHPAVAQMLNTVGPGRSLTFLGRYLQHQMELGVLRRMDPGAAARCFVGPLLAYVLTREVFPQPDSATLAPATMVATAVEIFLAGMQPAP
ncbi:TetR/AcrR family transcriptional regulator [Kallotenue papyrolyticum]|uniref:TetR/AcrR family transcriptional regulator n=1 Tax=Kallotenue papyrolyticum TaxID=1325125 RepID=UPI0004786312|nr:TetR/AcrR family transcriptional regulator [Kallotenue papyrolyticum]